MTITKRPRATGPKNEDVEAFINRAPDAGPHELLTEATPQKRKNKVQIAITIDPDLLAKVDVLARRKGLSRAGAISLACAELLERAGEK